MSGNKDVCNLRVGRGGGAGAGAGGGGEIHRGDE